MTQRSSFSRIALLSSVVFASFLASPYRSAYADTTVFAELSSTIKAPNAVAQLGTNLFGDKVNLYNGSLTFEQTDVSLPGTGTIPVTVGRRLATGTEGSSRAGRPFGIWDLDIPYLYGVFASTKGWTNGLNTTQRCSSFSAPPDFLYQSTFTFQASDYWQGNMLHVPGGGDQLMLLRSSGYTNYPSDGASYPIVTSQLWAFSCLTTLANAGTGVTGEGFLAVSPDGTRYRFDQMVSVAASTLRGGTRGGVFLAAKSTTSASDSPAKPGAAVNPTPAAAQEGSMERKEVRLYPTLITDRHGNTVTFSYDTARPGNLKTITASDGRKLTFSYENSAAPHLITSVSDGVRTWRYTYSGTTLSLETVTQPDGSKWTLSGINPLLADISFISSASCDLPASYQPTKLTGTMTHPSGATGSFTLTPTTHGRSNVQLDCLRNAEGDRWWSRYPRYFYTQSLTNKSITGPGLSTLSWTFDYGTPNASWNTCTSNCPTYKSVLVTDPSSFVTRYLFGNVYQRNDGKLIQTDAGWNSSSGTGIRTTKQTYRVRTSSDAYADFIGSSGTASIGDADMAERPAPLEQKIVTQQGVNFTWTGSSFDVRVRPTVASKSSSLGSRTETTAFSDNTVKWVLGQVGSVTESSTGKVMVQNTYDPTTANLLEIRQFGMLKETRTYNTDGTLKTSKDGKNQTTTYGNYAKGIPQLTTYADTKTQSAVVNSLGLVTSTTDELGYTTSYGYDSMNRLSSITYPSADSVAWAPTTITFAQVQAVEYGIATGHWRKTVATGNATEVTYFDGLWRPVLSRRYDAAEEANTRSMVLRRFDFNGAPTFESYPQRTIGTVGDTVNGVATTLDALGRPSKVSANSELGVLNTTYAYNSGFKKAVTNPRNLTTTYGYQAFDEPSENAIASIVEPYAITTTIGRDIFGKTTSIYKGDTSVNTTKYYVYDTYARLCKTIEAEGITVQDYDAADNVSWRALGQSLSSQIDCNQASVPAAQKINYGYDTRNRLLTTSYADGSAGITRTLYGDGLLNTIASNGTTWTYNYNKRRLLETETLNYLSKNYVVRHGFNANGSEIALTYPDAAATKLPYTVNALGQTKQVGDGSVGVYASAVAYHPNGAIASFTYGSGIAHTLAQNIRGLPQQSIDTGVINDSYTYDENGNVKSITDNQENINSRTMAYNDVDALTTVTAPNLWGTATYANDALRNVRGVTLTAGATARQNAINYDPATNRVHNISNPAVATLYFQYDRQGNITTRGSDQYVFDMANRMTAATGKATYVYDGLGRRVSTVKSDQSKQIHVYTQDGVLVMSTNQVGTGAVAETRYAYLNGSQIAELGIAFIHTDGLRSPVARVDGNRVVLSRTRYEPYGLTAAGATPTVGFTGHVNDANTGLVYMQQRYYDPVAARFLSVDPVLTDTDTGGNFSRYNYANNSPYKYLDPDGRFSENVCAEMVGNCTNYGGLTSNSRATESVNQTSAQYHFQTMGSVLEAGLEYYTVAMTMAVPEIAAAERISVSGLGVSRVGRWMSKAEADSMQATGRVQESFSGTTHVASPADPNAFIKQAEIRAQYMEFNVPTSALRVTNQGWASISGPNSLAGRLAARRGMPITEMPTATEIKWIASKFR